MDSFEKTCTEEQSGRKKKGTSIHTQSTEPTVTLNESLRTAYIDDRSLSTRDLSTKDISNKEGMRQVLDECQEQLSALTSMVEKIEVDVGETPKIGHKSRKRLPEKPERKNSKYVAESSQDYASRATESQNKPLHQRFSTSRHNLARHSVVSARSRKIGRSRKKQSIRRDSIHSCRSFSAGMDDGASIGSKSLHSVSYSVKSLPREIELMDDDDNDTDNYSFFDDSYRFKQSEDPSVYSQSVTTSSAYTSHSESSRRSKRSLTKKSIRPSEDDFSYIANGSTARDNQSVASDHSGRRSRNRKRGVNVSLSTSFNASSDTIQVENQDIIDPYGEEGVYSGALSKSTGMPNGRGLLEYHKDGRWCEGDWIHGRLTGYGRLSNGTGDFYEGGLKNDHFHGTGVMRFDNGRVFEGTYIKGKMIQGKMTYQDGSIYDGSWADCSRHGHGKCIFADGSIYEGDFRSGHMHGHGKMFWNDGGSYVGDWYKDQMHGTGKEVRPNGTIRHNGEWAKDQPVRFKKEHQRNNRGFDNNEKGSHVDE